MQETWVRSLGREDPLEKEMATPCTILAQRIPWTEEPGGLQSTGSQRVGHDWVTSLHFTSLIGRDQDAEKDWGQEKGAAEDEMVRQNYQLNAHECEQTPGDSEGQARLVCYSPWGLKESDVTQQLNNHNNPLLVEGHFRCLFSRKSLRVHWNSLQTNAKHTQVIFSSVHVAK